MEKKSSQPLPRKPCMDAQRSRERILEVAKEALTNVLVNYAVKNGELRRVLDPLTCFER